MTGTEQFISSLVSSLAWPAVVASVALLFRGQISDLLASSLKRLKAGPFEFEFDRVLTIVSDNIEALPDGPATEAPADFSVIDDLSEVARMSPRAAVLEAHSQLETRLWRLTKDALTEDEHPNGAIAVARAARSHGVISPATENAIVGVTTLRNLTAHARQAEVSPERALDYLALIDGVLFAMDQDQRGSD